MEFPVMAHAESNRSSSLDPNAESVGPARSAYASPRLLKLDLTETEGLSGGNQDGIGAGGSDPI